MDEQELAVAATPVQIEELDKDVILNLMNNLKQQNETLMTQLANMNKIHADNITRANNELNQVVHQSQVISKYYEEKEKNFTNVIQAFIDFTKTEKILKELN